MSSGCNTVTYFSQHTCMHLPLLRFNTLASLSSGPWTIIQNGPVSLKLSSEYTAIKQAELIKGNGEMCGWLSTRTNISLFYNALSLITGVAEWRGHHVEELLKVHFSLRKCALFGLKCSPLLNCLCNTFLSLTGHDTGCKPIKQILQEAAVQTKGTWAWGKKCTFICIVMPEEHGAQFKDQKNLWHSSRISQQDCACLTHCPCWESRGKARSNLNPNDSTGKKKES